MPVAAKHAWSRMRHEDAQYRRRHPRAEMRDFSDGEDLLPCVVPVAEAAPIPEHGYLVPVCDRRCYSLTTESSLAANICSILRERGWKRVESEFWFSTGSGEDMFRPVAGHGCEFCDRAVFSHIESRFELSECLFSKSKLWAMLCERELTHLCTETFAIRRHAWHGGRPPTAEQLRSDDNVWFLKREDKDYGTGITVCKLRDAMAHVERAPKHCEYVLQKHVPRPLLTPAGSKFSIRIYGVLHAFACRRTIGCWIYTGGYIAASSVPWSESSKDTAVQITTNRTAEVKFWELPWYKSAWPGLKHATGKILRSAAQKVAISTKRSFELFGFDFMISENLRPYCLEVNSGPVTDAKMDLPMLRQLVGFALVSRTEAQQLCAARSGMSQEDPRHWQKLGKNEPALFALANEVPVDDTPFKTPPASVVVVEEEEEEENEEDI